MSKKRIYKPRTEAQKAARRIRDAKRRAALRAEKAKAEKTTAKKTVKKAAKPVQVKKPVKVTKEGVKKLTKAIFGKDSMIAEELLRTKSDVRATVEKIIKMLGELVFRLSPGVKGMILKIEKSEKKAKK